MKHTPHGSDSAIGSNMSASFIWDSIWSSCKGLFNVVVAAIGDIIAVPGRPLVPISSLMQSRFAISSPALSAIVSGQLFPNIMLCATIGLLLVVVEALRRKDQQGRISFVERALMKTMLSGINVWRILFAVDACLQIACIAAAFVGHEHVLPAELRIYAVQSTFLAVAYLAPFVAGLDPYHHISRPSSRLLAIPYTLITSAAFLRVSQLLTSSGSTLLAGVAVAHAAQSFFGACIASIFNASLTAAQSHRVPSARLAVACCVLSLHQGRWLPLDLLACYFALRSIDPWRLDGIVMRRVVVLWRSCMLPLLRWMHSSFAPLLRRWLVRFVDLLCRLSVPFSVLYRRVISPIWCLLSPAFIPSIMAFIGYHRVVAVASAPSLLLLLTDGVCAAAALVAALVLYTHAVSRIFQTSIDPFKFEPMRWMCVKWCDCVLLPFDLLRLLWSRFLWPIVFRPLLKLAWMATCALASAIAALASAVYSVPLISMPCILAANIFIMYTCYSNSLFASAWDSLTQPFTILKAFTTQALSLPFNLLLRLSTGDAPPNDTDIIMALALLAATQALACFYMRRPLHYCRPLPPPASPLRPTLSPPELQALAESMSDPRQVRAYFAARALACVIS